VEQLPIETTVYSMSPEPPAQPDRRADERHLTLFRVGTIIFDDRRELCLVKNISAGGALIRAYCRLRTGMPLQIELKEQQRIAGSVTWVRGTDAGLTFDDRVDILDLLKSGGDGPRPRMPRIEARCICFVREGATVHRCVLHNISQGGISVDAPNPLAIGGDVMVTLPGMAAQGGIVRWSDGERYGISFNAVLPLAGLVGWLHERSSS
jgi:hypothetical protein